MDEENIFEDSDLFLADGESFTKTFTIWTFYHNPTETPVSLLFLS